MDRVTVAIVGGGLAGLQSAPQSARWAAYTVLQPGR